MYLLDCRQLGLKCFYILTWRCRYIFIIRDFTRVFYLSTYNQIECWSRFNILGTVRYDLKMVRNDLPNISLSWRHCKVFAPLLLIYFVYIYYNVVFQYTTSLLFGRCFLFIFICFLLHPLLSSFFFLIKTRPYWTCIYLDIFLSFNSASFSSSFFSYIYSFYMKAEEENLVCIRTTVICSIFVCFILGQVSFCIFALSFIFTNQLKLFSYIFVHLYMFDSFFMRNLWKRRNSCLGEPLSTKLPVYLPWQAKIYSILWGK